ncbi:MAG: Oligopeptide-binding protein AppA [candidate division WS2 bacterium]|nr:Oligopeptide-binding protein AppA [Candidatus Lithacetigena glycinireducens]
MGWVTLGYRPEHQYLSHRSVAGFRLIAPLAPATRAEVAYGIYHIMNPPREGGTISTATWQEPDTLHHYITTMLSAWSLLGMVDLPSAHRDENWALFPGSLREIPTVENGLWKVVGNAMEITFRQRPGLKFHDGKPATLDDWAYNFMVFMDEMTPVVARVIERKIDFEKGTGAHGIRGFDFLAPDVVRVYFKELDWRANLGLPGLGIYPRHVTEPVYKRMKEIGGTAGVDHFRINEVMARKPIGMGPYKIVEWRPGSFISLERFDDYILGKPLVRRIIHRFIPDTTAFLARVIAGKDVHITCQVGLAFTHGMSLEKRRPAHLKLHFARSLTWEHIGVNLENPDNPMIDLRVRKAFIHAINRREMVERLFRGRQPVAHSYLPPEHWGYDDAAPIKYEHNLELARKLLDEAGWRLGPDGWRYKAGRRLTLELRTTIDPVMRQPVQAVLKAQLKKVGIDLDITRNMPAGVLFARDHFYGRRWPHLIMFAWSMSPTSMGDTIFRGDMIPSPEVGWEGQNVYFWKNDEATELLKKAPNLMSEVERRKALFRVQRLISEELPVIPLYFRSTVMAHHANIATVRPGLRVLWNPYYWYWR